ncbi:serine hydrolase [Allobranchiibius sp. GilTou73]|uniref:serine hydrolase domain-containing protein n=1 Tax=Allobranchiibius sp. GilTou73 TaxID=2904523 RepID=UPI001F34FC4E|nr:serine hydrolase domain-containing protein [Allobranchiibius sp. GilTou73]UIJ34769.1 beta-lactamase family protein [Allobranchiibius sp. GilTou73]
MSLPDTVRNLLDAELDAAHGSSRCPSIAAALFRQGDVVWSGACGRVTGRPGGALATPDTAYRIGSITKTLTAIGVLQQVAAGRVSLDDPVGRVLTELPPEIGSVTVRALLTHGSGLLAEPVGPWWERSPGRRWEQLVSRLRLNDDLIGRFHYSNTGFAILGELTARLGGRSWWDLVRDNILLPLGMDRTTYDAGPGSAPGLAVHPDADLLHAEPAHDSGAMAPAGQLWSTVGDLARLGMFLADGAPDVVDDTVRHRMQVPALVDDVPGRSWSRAYGFGLDVIARGAVRYVGHGGSMPGFVGAVRVDARRGVGVAVLCNSTVGFGDTLATSLLDVADQVPSTRAAAAPTAPADTDTAAEDIGGRWYWGPRPYRLRALRGGELELAPDGGGRGSRFVPSGPNTWTGLDEYFAGERLRMHRRDAGPPHPPYLDLGTFRFTRAPYDPDCDIPGGTDPAGWH